jgi:predicted XRE-type DNA-binding protein
VAAVEIEVLPEANPDCIEGVKLALLDDIAARLKALYKTQQAAADALGIVQPTVAALMTKKLDRFSINWLVMTATRLGLDVEIGTRPCDS